MHASAMGQIIEYLAYFEGSSKSAPITWMYLDERGLVSTGVGILIDDPKDPMAVIKRKVKFYKKSDNGEASAQEATDAEIRAEYDKVKDKAEPDPDRPGELRPKAAYKSFKAFESITDLRIRIAEVGGSAMKMVSAIDGSLRRQFGAPYDTWPADVQVTIMQMAYGGGLDVRMKEGKLGPLLTNRDWYGARVYTYLSNPRSGQRGYIKYNRAFEFLMINGWIVEQCKKMGDKMTNPAPKDPTIFYGLQSQLWVARWNRGTMTPEIYEDDLITGGDARKWLNDYTLRALADSANQKKKG